MSADAPDPPGPAEPPVSAPPGAVRPESPPSDEGSAPAPRVPGTAGQPNTQLLIIKDKVQRYLADLVGVVELTADGEFTFQSGSARVFVRCTEWGEDETLVGVTAPVLVGCKPSAELYEYIATESKYVFGHLSAEPLDDGTVMVMFGHTLLGGFLDPDELKRAVVGVVATADQLDDELKPRFGGKRFHDDVS